MNVAVLRGREHTVLGAVGAVAEGCAALALSRGGVRKRYRYVDPNEDVVAFAQGPGGVLLVAADGHGGYEAAEAGVERLLERAAEWTAADARPAGDGWEEQARVALFDACQAIQTRAVTAAATDSRTTLAFAVVRPGEDALAWASMGDSHVFAVRQTGAADLAGPRRERTWFVGHPAETAETLAPKVDAGVLPLAGVRVVAVVTDGLSERGIGVSDPAAAVGEAAERGAAAAADACDRMPLETARGIVDAALEAHRRHGAGDNVGSAVWAPATGSRAAP